MTADYRAVLDQYCVPCHNQRTKTANLSLQSADVAGVTTNADLWEKVARKLRRSDTVRGAAHRSRKIGLLRRCGRARQPCAEQQQRNSHASSIAHMRKWLSRPARAQPPHEDCDDPGFAVGVLPRSVDVCVTQRHVVESVHAVIVVQIIFGSELADAVRRERQLRRRLGRGPYFRFAVYYAA